MENNCCEKTIPGEPGAEEVKPAKVRIKLSAGSGLKRGDTDTPGTKSCGCGSSCAEEEPTAAESSCGCGSVAESVQNSCGCGSTAAEVKALSGGRHRWVTGEMETPAGRVPIVATSLNAQDRWGAWKARWGINRMNYKINPGIYGVGTPDSHSPVLVTANYKLTFDSLRKELQGLDAWILVLDTRGINVWCAAGKGTFGTKELVLRIAKTGLAKLVEHRTLIVPQLGAPGISAHEVTKQSGFKIAYGPVRARDLKEYIASGMQATKEMRTVRFTFLDRLVLTPMELVPTLKPSLMIFGVMFLLNVMGAGPFEWTETYAYIGAILAGTVATPLLLPWIPGKAFSWKGGLAGILWAFGVLLLNGWPSALSFGILKALGFLLVLPSISAFCAMNFTGSSTYTSPTGVLKEMKAALPVILGMTFIGLILILIDAFLM